VRRKRLTREEVEERLGTTGGFMIPLRPGRRSGLIWVLLVLVVAALALSGGLPGGGGGVNFREVLKPFPPAPAGDAQTLGRAGESGFVRRVARDVQQMWRDLFRRAGIEFRPAVLVVSDGMGRSDCGVMIGATTPFHYCEYDGKLVLDEGIAYPILVAHGYAHHVQELLGITDHVLRAEEASPRQARDLWLKHELQADCLAGVWAHSAYAELDVADAVVPAPVAVEPDHQVDRKNWGVTAVEERTRWFRRGFANGVAGACNTFSDPSGRS
jgi:predicted metalloprotease